MELIKKKLEELNNNEIEKILNCLKSKQTIVIQSDTIYGFSCLASSDIAIKKLNKIKERSINKSFIVLISSFSMLSKYAHLNFWQKDAVKEIWQKKRPTSIILKSQNKLAKSLEKGDSLAFRLPKSQIFIKIIKRLGEPVVSTSFNFSGHDLIDINQVSQVFKNKKHKPALIINSNDNRKIKASRLVDLRNKKVKILRK